MNTLAQAAPATLARRIKQLAPPIGLKQSAFFGFSYKLLHPEFVKNLPDCTKKEAVGHERKEPIASELQAGNEMQIADDYRQSKQKPSLYLQLQKSLCSLPGKHRHLRIVQSRPFAPFLNRRL